MKVLKIAFLIILIISTVSFIGFKLYSYFLIRSISSAVSHAFLPDSQSKENDNSFLALKSVIKDKTIIGFGEATHGTIELRAAFCVLAKRLIEDGEVNVVAFGERDFSEITDLNSYVRYGDDNATGQHLLPYATDAEQDLVLWIRNFNKGKDEKEKVDVIGLDIYNVRAAASNILTILKSYDLEASPEQIQILNVISSLPFYYNIYKDKYPIDRVLSIADTLEAEVKKNKDIIQDDPLLFQILETFRLSVQFRYTGDQRLRDAGMFNNLLWAMEQRPSKTLIFGHNSHLEKEVGNTLSSGVPRLGHMISERFADEYLVIGSDLSEGKYQAGPNNMIYNIPTSYNKIGNILAKCLKDSSGYLFWNKTDTLRRFFNNDRFITYGVLDTYAPTYPIHKNSSDAFDILYWSEKSTPAVISGNNSFTLFLPISKNTNANLMGADSISISLSSTFSHLSDKLGNPTYSFGIAQFSEGKNIVYDFVKMDYSDNRNLLLDIKDNCDSLNFIIYGESVDNVILKDLYINEKSFPITKMLYDDKSYNSKKINDSSLELSLSH